MRDHTPDRAAPGRFVRNKTNLKLTAASSILLSLREFRSLVFALDEPFRTMVTIAQSLGLTGDELLALRWRDVDFEENLLLVSRNLADARRSDHRTEDSKKRLVVHDALLQVLLDWSDRCPLTEEGWIFADPSTDQPYMSSEIEVGYLAPAGVRLGLGPVGWHSLRQTYGSLLDNAATPVLLQQDLLQHLWTAGPGL